MPTTPGRGRGNSGGRGSGNRSQGKKTNKHKENFPKTKPLELKFAPQSGRTITATYASVKEAVIQHIQKTYKNGFDVAQSLEDMQLIDLDKEKPIRQISTESEATAKAIEQDGFNIDYQEQLRCHYDRRDALKEGMNKAYALIFTNYCTETMQSQLEAHTEFAMIKNDPIATLEAINTLMHDNIRA